MTPKNSEVDRPDNVTIVRREGRRLHGSEPAHPTRDRVNAPHRVVERTFAWLHNRRRLLIRTDRRHEIHEAFLALACCLICWRRLENSLF